MKKSSSNNTPAHGIHWDLGDLYHGMNDKRLQSDKDLALRLSKDLEKKYKGTFSGITSAKLLLAAIEEYEEIFEKMTLYVSYASYLHSIDTADPAIGKFFQEAMEFEGTISSRLAWFEIELVQIPQKHLHDLIDSDTLKPYRQFLKKLYELKPYTLSENEEIILTKKSQTSSQALIRLFDEVDSGNRYTLQLDGKDVVLSYSQLTPYLTSHKDRSLREKAAKALYEGLNNKGKLYSFTLNSLLLDKKIVDEIRGYTYPQQSTFLKYQVDKKTVDAMVQSLEKGYAISEKYYLAKKKLLGLNKLFEWDRYSFVGSTKQKSYTWDESRALVISSLDTFSPVFRDTAEKFFDNRWIHAEITPNKRSGAYCSYNAPSKHPYVLVNYAGQIRDVMTVAHELGHGIHGYLAQKNRLLQAWPTTVTAEIASIFSEMMVFETIYRQQTDKEVKINLLADKIQNIFASVFRQNAFYLFESDIHDHRRAKGELTIDDFNGYYQKRLQDMFGKGLTLSEFHKNWWMTILHFYRYNFYVFSYSFGEMLSLALYARYKEQGSTMVADYIDALSLGGSENTFDIVKRMGINIHDKNFWNNGLTLIDNYVDEFVHLTK